MRSQTLLLFGGGLGLIVGLWFVFKPQAQEQLPTKTLASHEREFHLDVDERVLAGPRRLLATQGDIVTLNIQSSAADELHVHGYDYVVELKAGQVESLRFTAEHSGRFELELHDSHVMIAVLEVSSR